MPEPTKWNLAFKSFDRDRRRKWTDVDAFANLAGFRRHFRSHDVELSDKQLKWFCKLDLGVVQPMSSKAVRVAVTGLEAGLLAQAFNNAEMYVTVRHVARAAYWRWDSVDHGRLARGEVEVRVEVEVEVVVVILAL